MGDRRCNSLAAPFADAGTAPQGRRRWVAADSGQRAVITRRTHTRTHSLARREETGRAHRGTGWRRLAISRCCRCRPLAPTCASLTSPMLPLCPRRSRFLHGLCRGIARLPNLRCSLLLGLPSSISLLNASDVLNPSRRPHPAAVSSGAAHTRNTRHNGSCGCSPVVPCSSAAA